MWLPILDYSYMLFLINQIVLEPGKEGVQEYGLISHNTVNLPASNHTLKWRCCAKSRLTLLIPSSEYMCNSVWALKCSENNCTRRFWIMPCFLVLNMNVLFLFQMSKLIIQSYENKPLIFFLLLFAFPAAIETQSTSSEEQTLAAGCESVKRSVGRFGGKSTQALYLVWTENGTGRAFCSPVTFFHTSSTWHCKSPSRTLVHPTPAVEERATAGQGDSSCLLWWDEHHTQTHTHT